jgi:hypothetical protein
MLVKSLVLVVLFPASSFAAGELVPVPPAVPTAVEAPAALLSHVDGLAAGWEERGGDPALLAEDLGALLNVASLDPSPERRAAARMLLWALSRRPDEAAGFSRLGVSARRALEHAQKRLSALPSDAKDVRAALETLRRSMPGGTQGRPEPEAPVVATARAHRISEAALDRLSYNRSYDNTEDALRHLASIPGAERAQALHLFMDGAFTQGAALEGPMMRHAAVALAESLESLTRVADPAVDAAFRRAVRLFRTRRIFSIERKPWDAGDGPKEDAVAFTRAFQAIATAVQRRPELLDVDGALTLLDALRAVTELVDAGFAANAGVQGKEWAALRAEPLYARLARAVEDVRPLRPDLFGPELDDEFRSEFARVEGLAAPATVRRHASALAETLRDPASTALVLVENRSSVRPPPPSRWEGIVGHSIWATVLGGAAAGLAAAAEGPILLIGLGTSAFVLALARIMRAKPGPLRLPAAPPVPDEDLLEAHRELEEEFPK